MTGEETKKCPRCAETIQAEAVACRFCGYTYGTPVVPMPPGTGARTNGLAIASLVLGIIWIYGVGSILALIFGLIGRRQIKESGGTQTGSGMATAGSILGLVGLIVPLVLLATVFFLGTETSSTFSCTAQTLADKAAQC